MIRSILLNYLRTHSGRNWQISTGEDFNKLDFKKRLYDIMSQQEENNFPLQNLNNNLFTLISAACTVEENDSSNDGSTPLAPIETKKEPDNSDDYDASDDEEPLSKMCGGGKVAKISEAEEKSPTPDDPASKENAGNQSDNT